MAVANKMHNMEWKMEGCAVILQEAVCIYYFLKIWIARQIHVMCIPICQNVFPEFIDSQLQTAVRLANVMLIVRSVLDRIKAIFISGRDHSNFG